MRHIIGFGIALALGTYFLATQCTVFEHASKQMQHGIVIALAALIAAAWVGARFTFRSRSKPPEQQRHRVGARFTFRSRSKPPEQQRHSGFDRVR